MGESDAKCEEIVRKLVLGEHHKDRAEERAARSDAKIAMLESELGGVNKTMKSLSVQGDENGKREEDLEEEIKDVKERFRSAEVNAEMAERTVQKLQTEIDRMETALLTEKGKKTRMEEDMEHLVQSIGDISEGPQVLVHRCLPSFGEQKYWGHLGVKLLRTNIGNGPTLRLCLEKLEMPPQARRSVQSRCPVNN